MPPCKNRHVPSLLRLLWITPLALAILLAALYYLATGTLFIQHELAHATHVHTHATNILREVCSNDELVGRTAHYMTEPCIHAQQDATTSPVLRAVLSSAAKLGVCSILPCSLLTMAGVLAIIAGILIMCLFCVAGRFMPKHGDSRAVYVFGQPVPGRSSDV